MAGDSICCSGRTRTAARGTRGRAGWRHWADTSRCCSVGARERLPVGRKHVRNGDGVRAPRDTAVGARKRMPVGQECMHGSGAARAPRDAAVVARARLPVERDDVLECGAGRAPRDAAVVARERLPVGPEHALCCERVHTGVGGGERRTRIVRRSPAAIWRGNMYFYVCMTRVFFHRGMSAAPSAEAFFDHRSDRLVYTATTAATTPPANPRPTRPIAAPLCPPVPTNAFCMDSKTYL